MALNKRDWIDRLNDDSLEKIISKKNHLQDTPDYLNRKIYDMFGNSKNPTKEGLRNEKKIFSGNNPLKFSFAFICLIILAVSTYFIALNFISKNKSVNSCFVSNVSGVASLMNEKTNKASIIEKDQKIFESSVISTDKDSVCELVIGEKSIVKMNGLSMIKLLQLSKKNNFENTTIAIDHGEIYFKPSKVSKGSSFKVVAGLFTIKVTGTEFVVKVDDNELEIFVKEGRVIIDSNYKIRHMNLKRIDSVLANKIGTFTEQISTIGQNEKMEIDNNIIQKINSETDSFVSSLENDFENNKNDKKKLKEIVKSAIENIDHITIRQKESMVKMPFDKDDISLFADHPMTGLNTVDESGKNLTNENHPIEENTRNESNMVMKNMNHGNDAFWKITELPGPDMALKEKNCSTSLYGKNIIIADDDDKNIYCLDTVDGKLKWKFADKIMRTVSSCPVEYKNNLIFGTPDALFVLNSEGKLVSMKKIENGVIFWPQFVKLNGILYIPTSKKLFLFDGETFGQPENFPDFTGQAYISGDIGNIYVSLLNEKTIFSYGLNEKSINWKSGPLIQRSFVQPLVYENFIITGDSAGNIYKFNRTSNEIKTEILKIDTGIISCLIDSENFIYFIANDGFLYKINAGSFRICEKLFQVDENPDPDIYFTKKIVVVGKKFFFNSNNGKIFFYDTSEGRSGFINLNNRNEVYPLIGTPMILNQNLFSVDIKSNIYRIEIGK
jgi:outer membrane protein assembly factor BamB